MMHFLNGLIFILNILDIVVHYLLKLHKEDNAEQKNSSLSSSLDQRFVCKEDDGERKDLSSSSSLNKQCRRFSLAEIKRATHDFDDAFVIGRGGFGNVYKGKIDFEAGIDVAIKRLNIDSNQGAAEFWAEIEMLSKFRHSHIVSLLGYHEEPGKQEMILVYEYMANGSLKDHLHRRSANRSPHLHRCCAWFGFTSIRVPMSNVESYTVMSRAPISCWTRIWKLRFLTLGCPESGQHFSPALHGSRHRYVWVHGCRVFLDSQTDKKISCVCIRRGVIGSVVW
ncbi:hypothetical protein OSB04_018679 [Centaurea solstitialis]|uniref:Protein kinase domain-containing protein n=1 Tax=Centaurea solstitialis TaxID=347529 RepID=A0AA38T6Z0_9ASTR|nr:hypothetical protein OSB04_018679 [Centaurea solstitialis]